MTQTNDGGRAFPAFEPGVQGPDLYHMGMSLRDYFAGQALTGIIANPDVHAQLPELRQWLSATRSPTRCWK